MIKYGFTINKYDKCVCTKIVENACIIICLYIGDMLILGTNIRVIKSPKRMLSNNFDMKDFDVANVILGIKIIRTIDGSVYLTTSQEYENRKMTVRVFSNHQKSNVFNELH